MSPSTQIKVLAKMHPALAMEIQESVTPTMTDTSRIPSIYDQFSGMFALEKDPLMKSLKFIAITLKLYCPASLIAEVRVKDGVGSNLATVLGYSDVSNISHLIGRARAYMGVKSFKDDVDNVVNWMTGKEER